MALVYISAGSNQGNRPEYLRMAAQLLAPAVKILRTSELYLTEPWGYKPQPSFYNLVWEAETELEEAQEDLRQIQEQEEEILADFPAVDAEEITEKPCEPKTDETGIEAQKTADRKNRHRHEDNADQFVPAPYARFVYL